MAESKPYLAIPGSERPARPEPPEPPEQTITWGQFKSLVSAVVADDQVLALIDWEQCFNFRIQHLAGGVGVTSGKRWNG
jgi:hypothetical protein